MLEDKKTKPAADKKAAAKPKTEKATTPKKAAAKPVLNATQLRQQEAKKLRAANKAKADKTAKAIADKKADETATSEKAAATPEKDTRKVFKDDRGQSFRFKKSAPKALNVDGVSTSLEDIIADKEIMLELVNGNSNYLEQIY